MTGNAPAVTNPLGAAVPLGDVAPARSRHAGRRSAVAFVDGDPVVGTADGAVRAVARDGTVRWRAPGGDGSVVTLALFDGGVAVGERGPEGLVRLLDADGTERWRRAAAADVGEAARGGRFQLPFVADAATAGGRLFVAARRYERRAGERAFESVVYALDPDGSEAWRYEADASPIALDARGGRVAVAYNRCPGDHRDGLVVLDADTGAERLRWDPRHADAAADGSRRVGDVALFDGGVAAASHADYRGYVLRDGEAAWRVDLGRPVERGDERVYAYPNHVHATAAGVVFLTGNSYPEEGRETDARHPAEHTALGFDPDGHERWRAELGGFVSGVGADGDDVVAPCAQHFRERDPASHALRAFSVRDGERAAAATEGVVTAAACADGRAAAVEEPVVYHDEGRERGAYRLHVGQI